jgi:hypothetical protein
MGPFRKAGGFLSAPRGARQYLDAGTDRRRFTPCRKRTFPENGRRDVTKIVAALPMSVQRRQVNSDERLRGVMKKGWLIAGIIVGVVLLVCGGLGFGLYLFVTQILTMTQPVATASDGFLGLLGQGKIDQAYASTSNGFRAQMDEPTFTAAVQQLGLTDYSSSSWNNRSINNSDGTVSGVVISKKGGSTPATIRLVYEQGAWKVVGVRYGGVELTEFKPASPPKKVPADEELRSMTTETLLDFNQAIQARDFTAFHAKTAAVLQKQKTPQEMQMAFQDFINRGLNIAAIKDIQPEFDAPPAIDENGWLVIGGRYSMPPLQLKFTLKYADEPDGWRLGGIDVHLGDAK